MAFKMRKDIKNSSYYVWFLGAQEAKGLRGPEYVLPVIKSLVEREKDVEPFKITLQVSSKGIKIIQNVPATLGEPLVPNSRAYSKNQKTEVIKHFIPHHTLTYVLQDNDIVAYILLLFNPVTKCPVHVHAHRCDSTETAFTLTNLLQTLIDRPENQKKLNAIEVSLKTKGLLPPPAKPAIKRPSLHASGVESRSAPPRKAEPAAPAVEPERERERCNGNLISRTPSQDRIANLYDSLAAELREKLGTGPSDHAPILLPPRDYDTVHRQKGNLSNIESRGCLSANVVGVNAKNAKKTRDAQVSPKIGPITGLARTKIGSSGGSSGIGSDHAPSPEQDSETRFLDNESSSDEDWNVEQNEDPMFLMQPSVNSHSWRGEDVYLPKVRRHNSNGLDSNATTHAPLSSVTPPDQDITYKRRFDRDSRQQTPTSDLEINHRSRRSDSMSGPDERPKKFVGSKIPERYEPQFKKTSSETSLQNADPRRKKVAEQRQRSPSMSRKSVEEPASPLERFQDAKEKFLAMERERLEQENLINLSRMKKQMEQPVVPAVAKRNLPPRQRWSRDSEEPESRSANHVRSDHDRYSYEEEFVDRRRPERDYPVGRSRESLDSDEFPNRPNYRASVPDDRLFKYRYASPSRRDVLPGYRKNSPSYDKYPQKTPERGYEPPPRPAARSYSEDCFPSNDAYVGNSVPYDEENIPLERYRSPTRMNIARPHISRQKNGPKSAPKISFGKDCVEGVRRSNSRYFAQPYPEDPAPARRVDPEEEKRRSFQELAKEFKRKSYQEHPDDRYRGFEREPVNNTPPRYRHSYAEPVHHHQPPVQHPHHGMLQRTNSFLAAGRMGLAPVHPY